MKDDPFRIQERGGRSLCVDFSSADCIRHDVLFEKETVRIAEDRMFVRRAFSARRIGAAWGIAFAIFFLLSARAAWIQIAQGGFYRARADENRFRIEVLPARRGVIRDRNGVVLAENIPSFDVRMRASDLAQNRHGEGAAIEAVAAAIGSVPEAIESALYATGTDPNEWVAVARDVPYERAIALSVELPQLSGVSLVTDAKRTYPLSATTTSLSHILGYVGIISPTEYAVRKAEGYRQTDEIGKTGVERSAESRIRGTAGMRKTEVDAVGRPKAAIEEVAPTDGTDVFLTIDASLQAAAERALREQMVRAHASRGSVIAIDPRDGALLALVSLPSYDNNIFAGAVSSTAYQALIEDDNRPLFARAIAGQFPSGSTIKPLIAAAAIAEGVIMPQTTVLSSGGIAVGPWFFPDWKAGGHGVVNIRSAIAWSVNTFFYTIGGGYGSFRGLGLERLTHWMRAFGLGAKTGVDLPGEAEGFVPSEAWKKEVKEESWYIGDTYNLSIGQGDLLVTPLQMVRATAAVANGGELVTPYVVRGDASLALRVAAPPAVWETVRAGMRDCVTYGSCRALASLSIAAAGKTGTAQWRADKPTHAWFIGFAPYDNPQIVVMVLIEEGGEGSSFAVPAVGDVLKAWTAVTSSRVAADGR